MHSHSRLLATVTALSLIAVGSPDTAVHALSPPLPNHPPRKVNLRWNSARETVGLPPADEAGGLSPVPTEAARHDNKHDGLAGMELFKRYVMGTDTCGFAAEYKSSPWTCYKVGAKCTTTGSYLGCCVGSYPACASTILTSCYDFSTAPSSCGPATLCCNSEYPSCFTWLFSSSTAPSSTYTILNCYSTDVRTGTLKDAPPIPTSSTPTSTPKSTPTSTTDTDATAAPTDTSSIRSPTSTTSTSNSSTTSPTPTEASSPVPVGPIVGGVVGGIAIIGIAVVFVFFMFFRHKRSSENNNDPASPNSKNNNNPNLTGPGATGAAAAAGAGGKLPLTQSPTQYAPPGGGQAGYYAPVPQADPNVSPTQQQQQQQFAAQGGGYYSPQTPDPNKFVYDNNGNPVAVQGTGTSAGTGAFYATPVPAPAPAPGQQQGWTQEQINAWNAAQVQQGQAQGFAHPGWQQHQQHHHHQPVTELPVQDVQRAELGGH